MNRQTKRMLQRQGQLGPDGTAAPRRVPASAASPNRGGGGTRPPFFRRVGSYLRDVRAELGKVLWPRRSEVVNYSTVVLTTLVLLAALIFGLNFVFAKGVLFLFKSP